MRVGRVEVGGPQFVVAAGPCSVETESQVLEAARTVASSGAQLLRGGAFTPRTSPYAVQGLGEEGLRLLASAARATGLATVTEVVTAEDVPLVASYADALQVGARNVQNYALLKALGRAGKPVLLKRGFSTTVDELLMSAEYILAHGNPDVILCERGIRTFETSTRNTLDLNAVAVLKQLTHLPVLVDPSHGTGRRELVAPLSKAALAVGADGLIIEVHPRPEEALSDGAQSLTPELFASLMRDLVAYAPLEGRTLGAPAPAAVAVETPLGACRDRIDSIDAALVKLLNERTLLALRVATIKRASGHPARAPEREAAVLDHVRKESYGPLDGEAVSRLFVAILAETRAAQGRVA
ncbi:MAG TPA: bifunctional 3-deoxy-7-phosphoheptulonate synthase/chorismate mutase [Vicinamibacteria bacterium]|nr:bifunctional 3-deoxy-7-phosphoheptulonate synthase/chorismate mutase [Vicinamibacteria bacterium]